MKHKTAELTGALLDAAVALADGRLVTKDEPGWDKGDLKRLRKEYGGDFVVRWYAASDPTELGGWEPLRNQGSPSTAWNVGGPIIERERITVMTGVVARGRNPWFAEVDYAHGACGSGDTPLEAAMRCYVASRMGEEVEFPDELA